MKKWALRVLILAFLFSMLQLPALASLQDHNVSDVTIVQSTDESNLYFPDALTLPDGTLLVVYYKSASHKSDVGTIWGVKSTDNGQSWGQPFAVVDRSAEELQARDPNLALLPDGTIILTYFTNATAADPGATYMLMSTDNGQSWGNGSNDIGAEVSSEILDLGIGKRGSIAVIDSENFLMPVYGRASGSNSYNVEATATGAGPFSTYHRDAVMLHYQKTDGEWNVVWETLIDREIDETALMYTGSGVVSGTGAATTFDGDLYAFAREIGNVYKSTDCGRSWARIATEEPRTWTTSGTIMSANQIIQPRFTKVSDDCWFVTYANYNSLNYSYDRLCRPVYGKMFYPEAGWYATTSRLIYDEVGHGSTDMADPCSVLTADGKLLAIYYNTSTKSIAGTFMELSEWPSPQEETRWEFWEDALTSQTATEALFSHTSGFQWAEGSMAISGNGSSMISKESISGNYDARFHLTFEQNATDGRDEGLYILPLFESDNANIAFGNKYKIRISTNYGLELLYGPNANGNYGTEPRSSGYTASRPTTLSVGTEYIVRISKTYDTLSVKLWAANEDEPLEWHCTWQDASIGSAAKYVPGSYAYPYDFSMYGDTTKWKFQIRFVDKEANANSVRLSGLEFSKNTVMSMNYSQLTVREGEKAGNIELNTTFYPNIFAQLPAPDGPVSYTGDSGVSLTPISHPVRVNRANIVGVSVGTSCVSASLDGLVDADGMPVTASCTVNVVPENTSPELTEAGQVQTLFSEDFDMLPLNANSTDDCAFSAFGTDGFYQYLRFYGMTKQAVVEDPDNAANRYLEAYQFSGNANGAIKFISADEIEGDYTFEADVVLPATGSGILRISMASPRQPVLDQGSTYILQSPLSSLEKMTIPDYEVEFRSWFTRGRLHGVGLTLFDEAEKAAGWQHIKLVRAGSSIYFKSWPKDGQEPADWEMIISDERLASVAQGYNILEFVSGNTDGFNEKTKLCIDNIRVTKKTLDYDVTLNTNGGTIHSGNVTTYTKGVGAALPTDVTRDGYTFEGWFDNEALSGDPVTAIGTDVTGAKSFYAKWKEITEFAVTLNTNGGTIHFGNVTTYTKGVGAALPTDVTRDGYTFEGWFDNEALSGDPVTAIGTDVTGEKTFYAKWMQEYQPEPPAENEPDEPASDTPSPAFQFTDVPKGSYYEDAVAWAAGDGITIGTGNHTFSPDAVCTRAQAVTFLWRAAGSPEPKTAKMPFTDAAENDYYSKAVLWAVENGITKGTGVTTFSPDAVCTRSQIVTFLWRAAGSPAPKTTGMPFADVAGNEFYQNAVLWAVENGITKGTSATTFSPDAVCTRSQIVTFLYRCMGK